MKLKQRGTDTMTTQIQWTWTTQQTPDGELIVPGETRNWWIGCRKVDDGCRFCYAEALRGRFNVEWGAGKPRRKTAEAYFKQPLVWDRARREHGTRQRVFTNSLADFFEDHQMRDGRPALIDNTGTPVWVCHLCGEYRAAERHPHCCDKDHTTYAQISDLRRTAFGVMDDCPNLDWLILTKRPENIRRFWRVDGNGQDPGAMNYLFRPNYWLGTSISEQESAEIRVPELIDQARDLTPVLFLSVEPLLGPIALRSSWLKQLDWVIVGGESQQNGQCRETPLHHLIDIVDQCQCAGVPVFVKQLGSQPVYGGTMTGDISPSCWPSETDVRWNGRRQITQLIPEHPKGGAIEAWAAPLRIRQQPVPRVTAEQERAAA